MKYFYGKELWASIQFGVLINVHIYTYTHIHLMWLFSESTIVHIVKYMFAFPGTNFKLYNAKSPEMELSEKIYRDGSKKEKSE